MFCQQTFSDSDSEAATDFLIISHTKSVKSLQLAMCFTNLSLLNRTLSPVFYKMLQNYSNKCDFKKCQISMHLKVKYVRCDHMKKEFKQTKLYKENAS